MSKRIDWFDLDYTLWNTNSKWWIVDKKNPEKYIIRLSNYEANLILSGYYKNDNHAFYYNGINGWLSNDLITKIKKIKSIDISDIGISVREYEDINLIEKQAVNLIVYIDRIVHLQNTKINLLTARGNKEAHKPLLDKLREDLKKYNIEINNEYFVNDPTCVSMVGSTPEKKLICILENIIGHKIKNNAFQPLLLEKYDETHFYDDEELNIEECKKINFYIQEYFKNTEPWLKQKIEEQIKLRDIKLYLHLVSTNELNPFTTEIIDVKLG